MILFLSVISLCAIIISLTYITDRFMPCEIVKSKVERVARGLEYAGHRRGRVLTHFNVIGENHVLFPIYMEAYEHFNSGDKVGFCFSYFLNKPVKIINYRTGESFYPALGIYSHFLFIVYLVFIFGSLGLYFRNNINFHSGLAIGSIGLMVFLIFV